MKTGQDVSAQFLCAGFPKKLDENKILERKRLRFSLYRVFSENLKIF